MTPKGFLPIGLALLTLITLPFVSTAWVNYSTQESIYRTAEEVPAANVALVLGAAVYGSQLSDILKDRVESAVVLFETGKVQQIIMSGAPHESRAMVAYAEMRGIKSGALRKDVQGLSTRASIERLLPEETVVIVSQAYHLPRALFWARHFDLKAVGLAATERPYTKMEAFRQREWWATLGAVAEVLSR